MTITAADIAAFDDLIAAAMSGRIPETVGAPIAIAKGVSTSSPRRTIIEIRRRAQQAFKKRIDPDNGQIIPGQMAMLENAVETLAVLKFWYEGL